MMQRRFISILGLECVAIVLAWMQSLHAVATDEAKYLLNIPYPHPPLVRWMMGLTSGWSGQEFLWRIILATLLIQSVWIVVGFLPKHETKGRLLLGFLWLSSVSVLSETGAILMAPITAVQGLVLCRLLLREKPLASGAGWVALLWLISLFTAYQAILFLPIVLAIFLRAQIASWRKFLAITAPVLLLALYTLSNPFVIGSMVNAGTQNASGTSLPDALLQAGFLWMVGGSLVGSVFGTVGMLRSRSWAMTASMLLILLFIIISYRPYYGILFAPLFIAGIANLSLLPIVQRSRYWSLLGCAVSLLFVYMVFPSMMTWAPLSSARDVAKILRTRGTIPSSVAFIGSPGHEWQYELSPARVVLRSDGADPPEEIVICLHPCPTVSSSHERAPMPFTDAYGVTMWERRE